MELFSQLKSFEWDEGNITKNWLKHRVTHLECEEVFFREPLIIYPDDSHSTSEERYFALGETDGGRLLFIVFTIRGDKIRVISARDASKKERRYYR